MKVSLALQRPNHQAKRKESLEPPPDDLHYYATHEVGQLLSLSSWRDYVINLLSLLKKLASWLVALH